jgi:exosortase family protein XrtM
LHPVDEPPFVTIRYSSAGIPYLAEADAPPASAPGPAPSAIRRILLFALAFACLQALWLNARDTAVERFVIDDLTVRPAAAVIALLTPTVGVIADGMRLKAAGGGISVRNGCEGIDVLLLLTAAFAACHLSWRQRLAGIAGGALLVFALNQLRIVALFYASRGDRAWFDALHGTVAPVILVISAGLFFTFWLKRADLTSRPGQHVHDSSNGGSELA